MSIEITLQHIQNNANSITNNFAKMDPSLVFKSRNGNGYNEFNIYLTHFGTIPNFTHFREVDCKKSIFLLPNIASALTNPKLLKLLIFNTKQVLVIEDAENIISDREQNGHSPASFLLNIADGLLSDCLKIQIICSFNTDLSKINKAFLRKGRLIARYDFKELTVEKAMNLSKKLGLL